MLRHLRTGRGYFSDKITKKGGTTEEIPSLAYNHCDYLLRTGFFIFKKIGG